MDQDGIENGDTVAGIRSRMRAAAAVNDRAVLANCLQRSPDIAAGLLPLTIHEDRPSAAIAYNEAIAAAPADAILILAHQDIYLPSGWPETLAGVIADLERTDPDWAVAGLTGKTRENVFVGHIWSTGMDMELVGDLPLPCRVGCMDEQLLVLNVAAGVRFDEGLPGFHLYGVDIAQEAIRAGRGAYVIDAPVIHHDKPIPRLDPSYRTSWRYEKRKWRAVLPIPTLIVPIDRKPFRLTWGDIQLRRGSGGGRSREAPSSDPAGIARRLGWEAEPVSRP